MSVLQITIQDHIPGLQKAKNYSLTCTFLNLSVSKRRQKNTGCAGGKRLWQHAVKAYGGVKVQGHVFFASVLGGGQWRALRPDHFVPWGKSSWPLLSRGVGGPKRLSESFEEKKNLLLLSGIGL